MITREGLKTSAEQWRQSRERSDRSGFLLSFIGLFLVAGATIPAAMLAATVSSGNARYPLTGVMMAAIFTPVVIVLSRVGAVFQGRSNQLMDDLERQLTEALEHSEMEASRREAQVQRQEFEARIANALEMADSEGEAVAVIERALGVIVPGAPVELLLADNSHAHLSPVVPSTAEGQTALCSVDSPDHCPAARRSQVQRFNDSTAFDACPKLQARPQGRCSAVCVPVSIMGRTVGIIHAIGEPLAATSDSTVQNLAMLANLAGARLGLLRVMAETQLQAATDSLTGLLNRRSLENKVASLRGDRTPYAVVMADLDHFKRVNDTYGHETGDRALRMFAQTMRSSLRTHDLICRQGGEEFALVLPDCDAADAVGLLESIQGRWLVAANAAGLPDITVSFGIVSALADEDLSTSLARADAALFQAKHEGRNCIVTHPPSRLVPAASTPRPAPAGIVG